VAACADGEALTLQKPAAEDALEMLPEEKKAA